MAICKDFDNIVYCADDIIRTCRILKNDKELKVRDGLEVSKENEAIIAFCERLMKAYDLENAVNYDEFFDDEEDEWEDEDEYEEEDDGKVSKMKYEAKTKIKDGKAKSVSLR